MLLFLLLPILGGATIFFMVIVIGSIIFDFFAEFVNG